MKRKSITAVVGILTGILCVYFFKGWVNVIPWTIISLSLGMYQSTRQNAIIHGAVFGYFLFFTYILVGYRGEMTIAGVFKILSFSILFSFVGALAGVIGAWLGHFLKVLTHRKQQ